MSNARRFLATMTDEQLDRLYQRLYDRAYESGGVMFGVDLATLRLTRPGLYNSARLVIDECKRRDFFLPI